MRRRNFTPHLKACCLSEQEKKKLSTALQILDIDQKIIIKQRLDPDILPSVWAFLPSSSYDLCLHTQNHATSAYTDRQADKTALATVPAWSGERSKRTQSKETHGGWGGGWGGVGGETKLEVVRRGMSGLGRRSAKVLPCSASSAPRHCSD